MHWASPSVHPLLCHPATPCPAARGLAVEVGWLERGLHLRYTVRGVMSQLLIPPPTPPARADGLWRHTCFEAFIGTGAGTAYHEFNFAPSGQWALYAFSTERVRDEATERALPPLTPQIHCAQTPGALMLQALIPAALLPASQGAALHLGLTAVIEMRDGGLSYWALHHPAATPDFHQTISRTARIPTSVLDDLP